jgi:hypothetical protein
VLVWFKAEETGVVLLGGDEKGQWATRELVHHFLQFAE